MILIAHFTVQKNQEFAGILSNLFKIALSKRILTLKYVHEFELELPPKKTRF